jgi:hypothetical protein
MSSQAKEMAISFTQHEALHQTIIILFFVELHFTLVHNSMEAFCLDMNVNEAHLKRKKRKRGIIAIKRRKQLSAGLPRKYEVDVLCSVMTWAAEESHIVKKPI